METNPNYKNEPTVGMNLFENIPPVGKENDAIHWGNPIGVLKTTIRATKDRTIEEVEKLQNKDTMIGLSTILTEQNRAFLEERSNEGTMDDLVSLIRAVWDNYLIDKLITLVEQPTQAVHNLGIDWPTIKAHGGDCQ